MNASHGRAGGAVRSNANPEPVSRTLRAVDCATSFQSGEFGSPPETGRVRSRQSSSKLLPASGAHSSEGTMATDSRVSGVSAGAMTQSRMRTLMTDAEVSDQFGSTD